ncbi:MAG: DUF790 family protein [Thermoplasmataceae archaeon]
MFPNELMQIRRTKDGRVFPVFLKDEEIRYCTDINSIFRSSKGRTRGEIEREIRELELRSEKHKIVRALGVIMTRRTVFVPPTHVPASEIRDFLFKRARFAVFREEEKDVILQAASDEFHITKEEVVLGMYGDKESEQVIESSAVMDDHDLAREFNMEMLETLLSRSISLKVTGEIDWQGISTVARLKGIEARIKTDAGLPVEIQIFPPSNGRGRGSGGMSAFLELVRTVMISVNWAIEAQVLIENKTWGRKDVLWLHLGTESLYYLPKKIEVSTIDIPPWVRFSREILKIGENTYFPSFEIKLADRKYFVFISGPKYIEDDLKMSLELEKAGINFVVAVINHKTREARNHWLFYSGALNWDALRDSLADSKTALRHRDDQNRTKKMENELDKDLINEVKMNIEKLYPDSDRIVDYIESKGLIANRVLTALGYKVRWNGLQMVVKR